MAGRLAGRLATRLNGDAATEPSTCTWHGNARRQQGRAEEYALELHSLQPGVQHPAQLQSKGPDEHHDTAGQAALRQLAAGRAAHGSNGGGGGQGDFGDAVVMIEEADDRQLFDWGTYFSSLPKKLKGEGS